MEEKKKEFLIPLVILVILGLITLVTGVAELLVKETIPKTILGVMLILEILLDFGTLGWLIYKLANKPDVVITQVETKKIPIPAIDESSQKAWNAVQDLKSYDPVIGEDAELKLGKRFLKEITDKAINVDEPKVATSDVEKEAGGQSTLDKLIAFASSAPGVAIITEWLENRRGNGDRSGPIGTLTKVVSLAIFGIPLTVCCCLGLLGVGGVLLAPSSGGQPALSQPQSAPPTLVAPPTQPVGNLPTATFPPTQVGQQPGSNQGSPSGPVNQQQSGFNWHDPCDYETQPFCYGGFAAEGGVNGQDNPYAWVIGEANNNCNLAAPLNGSDQEPGTSGYNFVMSTLANTASQYYGPIAEYKQGKYNISMNFTSAQIDLCAQAQAAVSQ